VPDVPVISYDPFVYSGHHFVLVENRRVIYAPDPDLPVVLSSIEVFLVNYDGMPEVFIPIHIEVYIRYGDVPDDDRSWSPAAITIVGFPGSQGQPPHPSTTVYPRHPSRKPEKWEGKERRADTNPDEGHGRSPIPIPPCEYPGAVVVSYVSKRFARDPGMVPIPYNPSARCIWRPSRADIERTPEIVIDSIVVNPFPSAMLVQNVSIMMEA
jgi:hypothetical protein